MGANEDLAKLADRAEIQWGLITTAQAGLLSISSQQVARLARRGSLQKVRHGVYRAAGTQYDAMEDLRALWLSVEPGRWASDRLADEQPGVFSHRTATVIHHLGNMDADRPDVLVPERRRSRQDSARYRVREVKRADWVTVGGLPVTTIPATIADLAAEHTDGDHLAAVVRDALANGADPDELAAALAPYADRYAVDGDRGLVETLVLAAGVPASTVQRAQSRLSTALDALDAASAPIADAIDSVRPVPVPVNGASSTLTTARAEVPSDAVDQQHALQRALRQLEDQPRAIERALDALETGPEALNNVLVELVDYPEAVGKALAAMQEDPAGVLKALESVRANSPQMLDDLHDASGRRPGPAEGLRRERGARLAEFHRCDRPT